MAMNPSSSLRTAFASLVVSSLLLVGCGGSDEVVIQDTIAATTEPAVTTTVPATTSTEVAVEAEPLQILVTNDDGYEAEGIDALVLGL